MTSKGSVGGRFGGFAAGHFTLSVFGFAAWMFLSGAGVSLSFPLYVAVLMLLYVPAGWAAAWLDGWPVPNRKTAVKAVLYPALCAWAWAFGGWFLMAGGAGAGVPATASIGLGMLSCTLFLASPSALFMLLVVNLLTGAPMLWWGLGWYGGMVLAGFLPPLLFFLGSLLPKKRLTTAKNVIE